MIKYQQQDRFFATKLLAQKAIISTRAYEHNKLDRAFVKKTAKGFVIMYYTFPQEIRNKIHGIYKMRIELTTKLLGYYEIALKPTKWILAEHARLRKLAIKQGILSVGTIHWTFTPK